MDDADLLLGELLGCSCRARCCGHPDPTPAPGRGNLFQQAGRGTPIPRPPEDTPFIPGAVPSFDSPQRTAPGHFPGVDAAGAFQATGLLPDPTAFTLDTGAALTIPDCAVRHPGRTVEFVFGPPLITDVPVDVSGYGVPSYYAWSDLSGDPRVTPINQTQMSVTARRARWTLRTQPMTGGPPTDQEVTTTGAATLYQGQVMMSGDTVTDYRLQERWQLRTGEPELPDSVWRRSERVIAVHPLGQQTLPEPPYPAYDVLHQRGDDHTRAEWEELGRTPGEDAPVDPESGFPIWETLVQGERLADVGPPSTPGPPPLDDDRWISPDGRVRVTGPRTLDHALIRVGERLSAYGYVLEPLTVAEQASWAGLCGPGGEPWVLIEAGGPVTLARPGGTESLARGVFEREVLRAPAGSFLRFAPEGLLNHTWPPQWALADCGAAGGARAVTLHDPWRDSVAGPPPEGSTDPAWWWWPRRPRRRPAVLPPDAPVAPLRLALADVWLSRDPGGGGGSS